MIAGASLKITLSCHENKLMLATGVEPELIRQIFGYVLACALAKYGLLLHGAIQMGNHYHLDVTDVRGVLPYFKAYFNGMLARALNAHRGRLGDFWDRKGSCDTVRDNDEESIGDLVYTETNAVAAGLVKWPKKWPGFHTAGWAFGTSQEFERPDCAFFQNEKKWPKKVSILRAKPPCLSGYTDADATSVLSEAVRVRCLEKQAQMKDQNQRFKGVPKLAKDKWWRVPGSSAKDEWFGVRPKVAVRSQWRKQHALQRNAEWEAAYAAADEAFKNGDRNVEFPYGTWLVRKRHGVKVAQR